MGGLSTIITAREPIHSVRTTQTTGLAATEHASFSRLISLATKRLGEDRIAFFRVRLVASRDPVGPSDAAAAADKKRAVIANPET